MRQARSFSKQWSFYGIVFFLTVVPLLDAFPQEADPVATPETLAERARQVFEAKEAIAKESAAWAQQKPLFESLIALREQEISEIDKFTESAMNRVTDVSKKRAELEEEERQRKAWRANFESEVANLESSLREAIPLLPPPVRNEASPSIARLKEGNSRDQTPLQDRFRDILTILSAAQNFDSKLTIDSEVREVEGERYQIDILYLGLDQAWFVDESGTIAGSGVPTLDGWIWTEDRSLAPHVRRAIEVSQREVPPAIVSLPFSARTAPSPSDD